MSPFAVALAARAFEAGRAVRSSRFRHRRLIPDPIAVVLWQLGGEPFAAAAVGWGDRHARPHMAVAGEPRNRDLAFAALARFAAWFNPRFDAAAADREELTVGKSTVHVARTAPQVVVANRATADLLGRLGRRLAYLPADAGQPDLVRLGRHLLFLANHAATPGQQLLVILTELLDAHWATPLSPVERASLPAVDAWIAPPAGVCGFGAAAQAELCPVGPAPDGDDDRRLLPLLEEFNTGRRGCTDPAAVGPLLGPVERHYRPLLRRAWDLVWRCRDREAAEPEAPSVGRRWDADRQAYTRHVDWLAHGGLRRTRQTARQAAVTLRDLEEAGRRVEAEEATDDPLRMAPYVLAGKAVRGRVVAVNAEHPEAGAVRPVRRPLVTVRSPDPCLIPAGRELYRADRPADREYVVVAVTPVPDGGSDVVLRLETGTAGVSLPAVGEAACYSVHSTKTVWRGELPDAEPWTHRAAPAAEPLPLEPTHPEA